MTVDASASTSAADPAPTAADAAADAQLNELSHNLTQLEARPVDVRLVRRQAELMLALGMVPEAGEAVTSLNAIAMLDEDYWIKYLDAVLDAAPRPFTLDALVDLLDKFSLAEKDYVSVPILLRHLDFIVLAAKSAWPSAPAGSEATTATAAIDVDDEVREFLSAATVRDMARGVARTADGLLSQSSALWELWANWEVGLLEGLTGSARTEQIAHIHELYTERLGVLHTDIAETSSAYSSFCSQYCPEEYEARLTHATAASQEAKHKLSGERRHGKTREDLESALAYAPDFATQAQTFHTYLDWETDARARNPKSAKAPRTDPDLTSAVFERAIVVYAKMAHAAEAGVQVADETRREAEKAAAPQKGKGKRKPADEPPAPEVVAAHEAVKAAKEVVAAYKGVEASLWLRYYNWLVEMELAVQARDVIGRAARACPLAGEVWAALIVQQEAAGAELEQLEQMVHKARAVLIGNDAPIKSFVDVVVSHAAAVNRRNLPDPEEGTPPVMEILIHGLSEMVKLDPNGDTSNRLERFLLEWTESRSPEHLPLAFAALDAPLKSRTSSYAFVLLRASVEARPAANDADAARRTYVHAIQRADLDWPEAVYEAFEQFENVHGDLESLRAAQKRIEVEKTKVARRREKEAQRQAEQVAAYQTYAEPAEATEAMQVDVTPAAAAVSVAAPAAASAAEDQESHLKRDREHTTVLVTGIKKGTEAPRIESFFEECGRMKETTMLPSETGSTDAALVEFRFVDAVPLALDRNGKKLDGHELGVAMLWRSTLFVTNFPRDMDDDGIRALFGQYGTILQTRWPSRKFAGSRRFCYITMASAASAQEAASMLDNYKASGATFGLKVAISDPSAKVKRTDASNSTLFVGGLNAKTTEGDVRALFDPHGSVLSVKLGWDAAKRVCKGFAFVEMATEEQAKASLALGGTKYHNRVLKVEFSDPNIANKKAAERPAGQAGAAEAAEKRARTVRLNGLPEGTQEGLLQQALEKVVPVRRLEIFARTNDAVVELEAASDAGKLLLQPFVFNGAPITITEHGRRPAPGTAPAPTASASAAAAPLSAPGHAGNALAFAPRVRKRAIGKGRQAPAGDRALPAQLAHGGAAARGQDDFRALVANKNEQRRDRLESAVHRATGAGDSAAGSGADAGNATATGGANDGPADGADAAAQVKRVLDDDGEGASKRVKLE
ncbi:Splicing factor [Cryptotrichosporon argae]